MTQTAVLLPVVPSGGTSDHDPVFAAADDHDRLAIALAGVIQSIAARANQLAAERDPGELRSGVLSVNALRGLLVGWCRREAVKGEFGRDAVQGLEMAIEDMGTEELGALIQGLARADLQSAAEHVRRVA